MERKLTFDPAHLVVHVIFQAVMNKVSREEHFPQEYSIFLCLTNTIGTRGEAFKEGTNGKLVKIAHCKPGDDDWD